MTEGVFLPVLRGSQPVLSPAERLLFKTSGCHSLCSASSQTNAHFLPSVRPPLQVVCDRSCPVLTVSSLSPLLLSSPPKLSSSPLLLSPLLSSSSLLPSPPLLLFTYPLSSYTLLMSSPPLSCLPRSGVLLNRPRLVPDGLGCRGCLARCLQDMSSLRFISSVGLCLCV